MRWLFISLTATSWILISLPGLAVQHPKAGHIRLNAMRVVNPTTKQDFVIFHPNSANCLNSETKLLSPIRFIGALRHIALNWFKQEISYTLGIKRKQLTVGWDHHYVSDSAKKLAALRPLCDTTAPRVREEIFGRFMPHEPSRT